eukprot:TRINITY_DN8728_c0_g1_i1.p1 TRINITY_DN8728_c0_g1~~TRINITY_DN8728_c0_g1_i1.p1  ORF type:complete len:429 (-),score=87.94 TRINITY_DN8728_c0_g1_i1:160-1446(-)
MAQRDDNSPTPYKRLDFKGVDMRKGHYSAWIGNYPVLTETQLNRLSGPFRFPFLSMAMNYQPIVRKCLVLELFFFARIMQKAFLVRSFQRNRTYSKPRRPTEAVLATISPSPEVASVAEDADSSKAQSDESKSPEIASAPLIATTSEKAPCPFVASDEFIIGIIGAGEIGRSFLDLLLDSGVISPKTIYVSTRRPETLKRYIDKGVVCAYDNRELVKVADVVFLLCLPSQLKDVCSDIKGFIPEDRLVIATQVGTTAEKVQQLSDARNVMRTNVDMRFVDIYCVQQRLTPPANAGVTRSKRFSRSVEVLQTNEEQQQVQNGRQPDEQDETHDSNAKQDADFTSGKGEPSLRAGKWMHDQELFYICGQSIMANGPAGLQMLIRALELLYVRFGETEEQSKRDAIHAVFGGDIDYHSLTDLYGDAQQDSK